MRPPLALAFCLLVSAAAAATVPAPRADWRQTVADARVRSALASQGWRFEADGRALDPKTKAPADEAALKKAVLDLEQDARRAALEAVNLMLAKPSLDAADRAKIDKLSSELPPALVTALKDPNADSAKLRGMANAELSTVAAYFDGTRSLSDRQSAAAPVKAGLPMPRVALPYFTPTEKSVGDKLRAGWTATIGKDPFGKTVLSRLNGKDGKPDLPPIVIEAQQGDVIAHYDPRRQTLVLGRDSVVASITDTVPLSARRALAASLADDAALLRYLDTHPKALAAVVQQNDVVMVHELTHAWQDRRETVLRETARGNLPDSQLLEYEEEAYETKNLYLHSKLTHDPASVARDQELDDYIAMMTDRRTWAQNLRDNLITASPARALNLKSVGEIQAARVARARGTKVTTSEDQTNRALELTALNHGVSATDSLSRSQNQRMIDIGGRVDVAAKDSNYRLGVFFLGSALHAPNESERKALLDKAEGFAAESKNPKLIAEIQRVRANK